MVAFSYASCGFDVRPEVEAAHEAAWVAVARPGSWWTGGQRVAIAAQARATRLQRAQPPWMRTLPEPDASLPPAAVEAARKITVDAAQIDRTWATEMAEVLGDAAYIELAAVVTWVCIIDTFAEAVGIEFEPFPTPLDGEPDGQRPVNVGPAGAHVDLETSWKGPHIGRALSLAPRENDVFHGIIGSMYAAAPGRGFSNMIWEGPLSRPQAELLAARVSALNECFY